MGGARSGRLGLERTRPLIPRLRLAKTYGDPRDLFGCYAELYEVVRPEPLDHEQRLALPGRLTRHARG